LWGGLSLGSRPLDSGAGYPCRYQRPSSMSRKSVTRRPSSSTTVWYVRETGQRHHSSSIRQDSRTAATGRRRGSQTARGRALSSSSTRRPRGTARGFRRARLTDRNSGARAAAPEGATRGPVPRPGTGVSAPGGASALSRPAAEKGEPCRRSESCPPLLVRSPDPGRRDHSGSRAGRNRRTPVRATPPHAVAA